MPVDLTIGQLSEAVALTVSGPPLPPHLAILTRQMAAAVATCSRFVDLDDVPNAIANEAIVAMVGYEMDRPITRRGATTPNSFRLSGAMAMLSPYFVPAYEAAR